MELKCQWMVLPELGPKAPHAKMLLWTHIFTGITVYFWVLLEGTFFLISSLFPFCPSALNLCIALLCSNQFLHLSGHWSNSYVVHQIILIRLSAEAPCVARLAGWFLYIFQRKSHLWQILVELDWSTWFFILSKNRSSVSSPLAHSTLLDSLKYFQDALSSAPLSNLCDEMSSFWT